MIYRCSAIPIKIPMIFFAEVEKIMLKFKWNPKELWPKTILKRKSKPEGSHFLISELTAKYQQSKLWYWHKHRHIDQCSRIESPEITLAYMVK